MDTNIWRARCVHTRETTSSSSTATNTTEKRLTNNHNISIRSVHCFVLNKTLCFSRYFLLCCCISISIRECVCHLFHSTFQMRAVSRETRHTIECMIGNGILEDAQLPALFAILFFSCCLTTTHSTLFAVVFFSNSLLFCVVCVSVHSCWFYGLGLVCCFEANEECIYRAAYD